MIFFFPAFLPLSWCFECHYPLFLPGLSVPSGECTAGFYCKGGAALPKPTDGVTGNICPVGTYCSKYPASIRTENFISHNSHIVSETLMGDFLRAWLPAC